MDKNLKIVQLPELPAIVTESIMFTAFDTNSQSYNDGDLPNYSWIKASQVVQNWCEENIIKDVCWGVQVIDKDLHIHRDVGNIKYLHLLTPGGMEVRTHFYTNEGKLLESYILEPGQWAILNVRENHNITGIEPGNVRIALTGRIF